MRIPFTKTHGAKNDFLLTWRRDAPEGADYPSIARSICDRYTGIGADGWMLVDPAQDAEAEGSIELYNSDGSRPELSGNGTRCAAAFLIQNGQAPPRLRIRTGAGVKALRLLGRRGLEFDFEMNMGAPRIIAAKFDLPLRAGPREVTLVDVGNPQCAVFVDAFDFDWRSMGAEIERHPHFPNRTNVSFVRGLDEHAIDVRFWERGAGETNSSGTGSTGAAAAAMARGIVKSPVTVRTPAGPLELRIEAEAYLIGPAVIVGEGYYLS